MKTDGPAGIQEVELTPNRAYSISKETWHQGQNKIDAPCHILEIQHGEKCEESDIERKHGGHFTVDEIVEATKNILDNKQYCVIIAHLIHNFSNRKVENFVINYNDKYHRNKEMITIIELLRSLTKVAPTAVRIDVDKSDPVWTMAEIEYRKDPVYAYRRIKEGKNPNV